MTRVFIFVCGIMNWPGGSKNWTGRAVTWFHRKYKEEAHKSEKIEYLVGVLRVLKQRARGFKLARTLEHYRGFEIHIVAHSNGAHVVKHALQILPDHPPIQSISLVAPAVDADFGKLGFNKEIKSAKVRRMIVYRGTKDLTLKLGHTLPARLLGWKTSLGIYGPQNVDQELKDNGLVVDVTCRGYGHGTFFADENFEDFMEMVVANAQVA